MGSSRVVSDNKARRFAERRDVKNRRLSAQIDQPGTASLGDVLAFLNFIGATDQRDVFQTFLIKLIGQRRVAVSAPALEMTMGIAAG